MCTMPIDQPCRPEPCAHTFCLPCLQRWAAISNTCPLCKQKFGMILQMAATGVEIVHVSRGLGEGATTKRTQSL